MHEEEEVKHHLDEAEKNKLLNAQLNQKGDKKQNQG